MLGRLFHPRTVAVIGASDRRVNWGSRALATMVEAGFPGRLFGVNPTAPPGPRNGFTMVPHLDAVPGEIDAVLISVGREMAVAAVRDCAARGVGGAVLIASGFGELGPAGRRLEAELLAAAGAGGVRLVGPNSFGMCHAAGRVYFGRRLFAPGPVALLTQSGNVTLALAQAAERAGLGLSAYVGVGNQIDVGFGELLEWFAEDCATSTVAMYVEGLPPGQSQAFLAGLAACRRRGKPVIVLKAGRSRHGAATAATHTGALASDDRVWRAALEGFGATRVDSVEALADAALCAVRVRPHAGRVLVVTDGGGDSVLAVDALDREGLKLASLSEPTQAALAPLLPPLAPRHQGLNPLTLDTPGGLQDAPRLLSDVVAAVAGDPGVDAVVVGGNFGSVGAHREDELAAAARLAELAGSGLRLLVQARRPEEEPIQRLRDAGVPVFASMDRLVRALATRRLDVPASGLPRAAPAGRLLPPPEAARLLASAGLACPPMTLVHDPSQVAAVATPACLKVWRVDLLHKSESGGVRLGLMTAEAVAAAAADLWARFPGAPLLVMPMLAPGFEILLGLSWDPTFGPVLAVGRGGIWAEVEDDVAVLPARMATPEAVARCVRGLRCYPMLAGGRGQPPLDLDALHAALLALTTVAERHPGITADLNPVMVYEHGLGVADARILLPSEGEGG